MRAAYSLQPFYEIQITGTAAEWTYFASAILSSGATVRCDSGVSPAPYSHAARSIRISHRVGDKLNIGLGGDGEILITGDSGSIASLAADATALAADCPAGYHIHIDYLFDDHY